ncbi:hypothetical protein ACHAPU_006847 [Fusarium lateritium]
MASLKRMIPLVLALNIGAKAFKVYDATLLSSDNLGEECVEALGAEIACHIEVRTFMQRAYRGPLRSTSLTDKVCTSECSASLRSWFNSVANVCDAKNFDGGVPMKFGGFMWAGWNETCVKDPKTKKYCNDVIEEFSHVPNIKDLPRAELCHVCQIRRLAMMQSSQYSVYDDYYKKQLDYVYETCGGRTDPTDILPPLEPKKPAQPAFCSTDKYYVTQEGDTCDSIARDSRVSGATLYMGNQELVPDCKDVPAGIRLCLPLECETYVIQPEDNCVDIENKFGLAIDTLRFYNSWLDFGCTNLHPATDFYGKSICISPQGGTFTGGVPESAPTPNPSRGDGYTREPVAPPEGAEIADKTTRNCGKWRVVEQDDTCTSICMDNNIDIGLFQEVNPSLKTSEACTGSLVPGLALCVGPTYNWKLAEVGSVLPPETTATAME